ncbi:MAG: VWA domain-containing protein [Candidatus Kapaibacterium sp.]
MQFRVSQTAIKSAFYSSKPVKDDGHFVFLLRPDANISTTAVLPKIFTFIIDVSGSMSGTKIRQAQEAAQYCISNLNPQDRFNVVAFNNFVNSFSATPVQATGNNIASANRFIANLIARGGTDLQGAAIAGLAQYDDSKTVNVIIFLTDGVAPMDHTMINNANRARVRMCVFGVGSDVNSQALARLAADNNGLAEFITETQNTSSVIRGFYDRIRFPLWTNLSMSIDGGATYDVLPTLMPDLNVGEQLVVAGRYRKPGAATITVRGTAYGVAVERRVPVIFSGDSLSDVFCPKVWARMRIDYLKGLMAKELPNTSRWLEWRSEIVRLSLRYGIVTEFTTYKDTGTISDVEMSDIALSLSSAAYPNPFSGSTSIAYTVYEPAPIRIAVYDMQGNELVVLLDSFSETGEHNIMWDGRDGNGHELAGGVYLCKIRVGSKERIVKLIIAR